MDRDRRHTCWLADLEGAPGLERQSERCGTWPFARAVIVCGLYTTVLSCRLAASSPFIPRGPSTTVAAESKARAPRYRCVALCAGVVSYGVRLTSSGRALVSYLDHLGRRHGFVWLRGRRHQLVAPADSKVMLLGINNRGDVCGAIIGPSHPATAAERACWGDKILNPMHTKTAAEWVHGRLHLLRERGSVLSFASFINDRGDVTVDWYSKDICKAERPGYSPMVGKHLSLWREGVKANVPALNRDARALGLGPHGEVTARIILAGEIRMILWDGHRLWTLPGMDRAPFAPVNVRGDVLATADDHAVLWNRGRQIDLGTLGGASTDAAMEDDQGRVVGSSLTAGRDTHAFQWERGSMHDLGVPAGDRHSAAEATNGKGVVAGISGPESPVNPHWPDWHEACVWMGGAIYHLKDCIAPRLPIHHTRVGGIDDRGEILVNGSVNGKDQAFLLIPE